MKKSDWYVMEDGRPATKKEAAVAYFWMAFGLSVWVLGVWFFFFREG